MVTPNARTTGQAVGAGRITPSGAPVLGVGKDVGTL
jgi:hypothetical protein